MDHRLAAAYDLSLFVADLRRFLMEPALLDENKPRPRPKPRPPLRKDSKRVWASIFHLPS